MTYLGDFRLGETFDFKFTTRAFASGAPTQLAGTPVISAYPGNSTTQLTAGITLTVDFDTVTGLNNVRVVATSGNGYATATNYAMVITTGTVGGVSVVGETVAHFSIENRSALMPTTAARTLDVSATGEAGLDWANIGSPTTAQNLSGTNIDADQVVASVTGAVGSVTGNVGGNVAGSVGSVTGGINTGAGVITTLDGLDTAQDTQHSTTQSKMLKYIQLIARSDAAIETDNATELTAINADGGSGAGDYSAQTDSGEAVRDRGDSAWITATGFSTHSAADVWAVATRVLTANTNLNDISAADVLTQVNAAIDTAIAELGVAAPTATPTLRTGVMLLYMMARNRVDVATTGTDAMKIYNNAGTQIASKAITDDGTDYSEAKMA